jgi:hypothetical protein
MNESPVPPFVPDPVPPSEATTTPQPAPYATGGPSAPPQGSQVMATWSMALGIGALVLGVIVFLSIPAAIVAIVLGIIVLAKHHAGKGKALAGIITGGITLLVFPILLGITIVAYNGITQRAQEAEKTAVTQNSAQTYSQDQTVFTPCFTYTIPDGYQYDAASAHCTTSVNIPNGDILTRITVKANTGAIGTLKDVVAAYNKSLQAGNASTPGVVDQEELTVNNQRVYYVSYKDANNLLFGNYIIPVSTSLQDENGKDITAYTVAGYTYNSQLKAIVRGVLDSIITK